MPCPLSAEVSCLRERRDGLVRPWHAPLEPRPLSDASLLYRMEKKNSLTFETHLRHHQKVSEKIWKISHRCNSMRSFIWSNRIQNISSQSKVILIFPRGSRKIRPSIFYFEGGNVRITQDSEEISQIWLHHSKERYFLGLEKFSWDFSRSFWRWPIGV